MAAAARLGISHAEFMGWPLEQRALMLALGRVERNTGQYGEWLPDATSDRADPTYYGEDRLRWTVRGPFTNEVERLAKEAEDAYRKDAGKDANMHGMFWTVDEG